MHLRLARPAEILREHAFAAAFGYFTLEAAAGNRAGRGVLRALRRRDRKVTGHGEIILQGLLRLGAFRPAQATYRNGQLVALGHGDDGRIFGVKERAGEEDRRKESFHGRRENNPRSRNRVHEIHVAVRSYFEERFISTQRRKERRGHSAEDAEAMAQRSRNQKFEAKILPQTRRGRRGKNWLREIGPGPETFSVCLHPLRSLRLCVKSGFLFSLRLRRAVPCALKRTRYQLLHLVNRPDRA